MPLGEAVRLVAKIDGYPGRTNDPPSGHQPVWRGDAALQFISFGFALKDRRVLSANYGSRAGLGRAAGVIPEEVFGAAFNCIVGGLLGEGDLPLEIDYGLGGAMEEEVLFIWLFRAPSMTWTTGCVSSCMA